MKADMRRRALATRDAHLALLELKKLVDDAVKETHNAELEAVYSAASSGSSGEIRKTLRVVIASKFGDLRRFIS